MASQSCFCPSGFTGRYCENVLPTEEPTVGPTEQPSEMWLGGSNRRSMIVYAMLDAAAVFPVSLNSLPINYYSTYDSYDDVPLSLQLFVMATTPLWDCIGYCTVHYMSMCSISFSVLGYHTLGKAVSFLHCS